MNVKNMRFIILAVIFSVFTFHLKAQTAPNEGKTDYYKQTKVVSKDKKESAGDQTGQFITFTKLGYCYDSNKDGQEVKNGTLKYQGLTQNNYHNYYGDSYWGTANYYFNSDFSRLNVRTADGVTYVYEKTPPPKGTLTSAKIKQKPVPVDRTNEIVIEPTPVTPVNPVIPVTPVNPVRQDDPWRPDPQPQRVQTTRQCPGCYGTGLGPKKYVGSVSYVGISNEKTRWCDTCVTYDKEHTHPVCTTCNGKKTVPVY